MLVNVKNDFRLIVDNNIQQFKTGVQEVSEYVATHWWSLRFLDIIPEEIIPEEIVSKEVPTKSVRVKKSKI